MKKGAVVILNNVRSTHNVGSVFRTADAAGISKIYLTGYTPAPLDRFGRTRKDVAKVSLGAELCVPWEQVKTLRVVVKKLKADGYTVVGVEQDARAQDYRTPLPKKCAFVFGNEVRGLSPSARNLCDMLIEIPIHGKKESLNVSVAAGIVLFTHN